MDKKVKNILYIDTEVFFTMLRKDRLDEITYKHLEMLAADESVRIKIPKSQHTHLHELRLDSMQHKQFASRGILNLISYFLDKHTFVFVDDGGNWKEFYQKVLEDLQVGYNVSIITDDVKAGNYVKTQLQGRDVNLQGQFYIVSSKELKEWLEKEVKEETR